MAPPALPAGYDPNNLLPMVGFDIQLGAGVRRTALPRNIIILANKIQADITRSVGATSYTTAKGTLAAATPTYIAANADADTAAGAGSEAALAYRAVTAQFPSASAYLSLVDENGSSVKATGINLFAGPPTTSGVVQVTLAGRSIPDVTVTTSDTATTVAAAVANAINQQTGWPVTATVSTATMTLTAKQGGTRGNNIPYQVTITAAGLTVAFGGGSGVATGTTRMGAGTGTDGAGADDITAALAAIAPGRYFIVLAHDDATNWSALKTHLGTYAAITNRRRQQGVAAMNNLTVGAAVSQAQTLNGQRVQVVYHRSTSTGSVIDPNVRSTAEIAAATAAGRLWGDSTVGNGGTVRGELAYPAANLNGMQLAAIPAQSESLGARLIDTELQQLLFAGISPIKASSSNPGTGELVRCVTSYSLDGTGNPTNAVRLTSLVTVTDATADRLEQRIQSEYPNKNLGQEPASPGTPPTHPDVIFPSMVLGSIQSELTRLQYVENWLVNTAQNNAAIGLAVSPNDPSLIIANVPESVIPPFNAFAGTLSELSPGA